MRDRRVISASGTDTPKYVGKKFGRLMARKVPKMVSPQFVRILIVCEVMVVLSVFYLVDWYYNRRPIPSWVLTLAGGTLMAIIGIAIALLTLPGLRNQSAILRSRARALPPGRKSVVRVYGILIGTWGFFGPYLIWYLLPESADHSRPLGYDLAILAFAAIQGALFLASINSIRGREPGKGSSPPEL